MTVRGSGFDESYNELPGVTVTHEGNALETSTISWDDNRVVLECTAAVGDEVTVTTLYGSDSAMITGSRIR